MYWDLERVYYASQIVAAAAVVVSLLFVGYQLRQNTKNLILNTQSVQVSAYHQAIDQIRSAWMEPDLSALLARSRQQDQTLTDAERQRLAVLLSANLFGHEIAMHLAAKGLIDPELWENALENNRAFLCEAPNLALLRTRPGVLSQRLLAELQRGQG